MSDGFSSIESREVSLNGTVYDFSIDYNSLDYLDQNLFDNQEL